MYVVYGYCNASFRGVSFVGGKWGFKKRGKVSVRNVDSINVLKKWVEIKVFKKKNELLS